MLLCHDSTDQDQTEKFMDAEHLSQGTDKYRCLVEKKREYCTAAGEKSEGIYGPRFQKIHLELSRINPMKVFASLLFFRIAVECASD